MYTFFSFLLKGKLWTPNVTHWRMNLFANCCNQCVFTRKLFYHVKISALNLWTVVLMFYQVNWGTESNAVSWKLRQMVLVPAFLSQVSDLGLIVFYFFHYFVHFFLTYTVACRKAVLFGSLWYLMSIFWMEITYLKNDTLMFFKLCAYRCDLEL